MSKVKICGLGRLEDIETVNRVLPDYIGFVFAPSRRRLDIETAAMLKEKLDTRISAAGVFVNEDIRVISDIIERGIIDIAQLHGDEDDRYIAQLKDSCGCTVIKAICVCDKLPPLPILPDYLLFDTLSQQRGGSGLTFDRNVLKDYQGTPYFLAGGLTSQNVKEALSVLSPYCVDVSSGVETNGIKDAAKIEEFVRVAKYLRV